MKGRFGASSIIRGVMWFIRRGLAAIFLAVIVVTAAPLLWRAAVRLYYQQAMYAQPETPARPVAIVFGAAVYANGRLSPVLRDRVDTAIALYKSGQVSHIIMSGDNRTVHYDEPGTMMAYAIEKGVAEEDVTADRAGHRTYDTCYRARHVFDVRHAVLVTQAFHLPRALLTCEGLGIEAVGAIADRRPYRGARWYEFRETAATLVAAWDVVRRDPPPIIEAVQEQGGEAGWPAQLAGSR